MFLNYVEIHCFYLFQGCKVSDGGEKKPHMSIYILPLIWNIEGYWKETLPSKSSYISLLVYSCLKRKENIPCGFTVLVTEGKEWYNFNFQVKGSGNIHYRYLSCFYLLMHSINITCQGLNESYRYDTS